MGKKLEEKSGFAGLYIWIFAESEPFLDATQSPCLEWANRIFRKTRFGKIMRNGGRGVAFFCRVCMVARRQKVKPKAGFMGKPCNSAADAPL